MSGGDKYCRDGNIKKLCCGSLERVPELLGTIRVLPEGRGGAEVAGAVPSTKHRDGDEEDDVETTA